MNYTFTQKNKIFTYILIGIGLIAIITGFAVDSHRAWANLLVNNFFFLAIALFGTFFVAMQYLSEAAYAVALKRVPEAMSQFLWVAGPLMLLIFLFGHHDLYHWTHHELYDIESEHYDEILAGKSAYLNIPFFIIRMLICIGGWLWATHLLRKYSLQQDLSGGLIFHKKSLTVSAIFLVFFAVTSSTSSWDWLMSVDAHWFSSIFGWYVFSGLWVSGTITTILFIIYLKKKGHLPNVNENHLHDMGKWMFAISMVWTYLWFSQFMLIWYANLPEEVMYFQFRIEHYRTIFFGMLIVNFVLPFFALIARDTKRNIRFLVVVGVLIFLSHWADVFVMVMPGTVGEHWHIGFIEVGTFLGFLGLFLFVVQRSLAKVPLEIENHPYLEESIHLHH